MHFRPFPVLTLFAVPAFVALVTLGVWQSQRAGWKVDQIAIFSEQIKAPPMTLDQVCSAGVQHGQIIAPPDGIAAGPALRVFGQQSSGTPGWKLLQAGELCDVQLLIQTGFDPLVIGGPGGVSPGPPPKAPDRFIIAPWPEKSFMAAPNAPATNEWHWYDAPAMSAALGQPGLDTEFLVLPLDGMPDYLVRTPPETHIGYAVTWFGMAIAFLVIYGLMHARAGRLRFGKVRSDGTDP